MKLVNSSLNRRHQIARWNACRLRLTTFSLMKLLFPADHLKSISVPKAFETMYLPHGEILPGECFSCVRDMLMRISIQISSHCAIPMGKNSSAVLDFFFAPPRWMYSSEKNWTNKYLVWWIRCAEIWGSLHYENKHLFPFLLFFTCFVGDKFTF